MKILDSKRSQNIGILASSLHKDFSEIEHGEFSKKDFFNNFSQVILLTNFFLNILAIYNLDTTEVSLEALQQIYEVVRIFFLHISGVWSVYCFCLFPLTSTFTL